MNAEDNFVSIAALLCEPTRAKMLWNLLDGRAYTASELSAAAGISPAAASNHLSKLLEASIVKVEAQGKHRYYSLFSPEIAYAVEGIANLAKDNGTGKNVNALPVKKGVKYCRTCYNHLAGFIGVAIVEMLEAKGYLVKSGNVYAVAETGWEWFLLFNILPTDFTSKRRPLTRQCLDWSERRPHLAGELGAVLLEKMFEKKWFRKVQFSRELVITPKGRKELYELLGVAV